MAAWWNPERASAGGKWRERACTLPAPDSPGLMPVSQHNDRHWPFTFKSMLAWMINSVVTLRMRRNISPHADFVVLKLFIYTRCF